MKVKAPKCIGLERELPEALPCESLGLGLQRWARKSSAAGAVIQGRGGSTLTFGILPELAFKNFIDAFLLREIERSLV